MRISVRLSAGWMALTLGACALCAAGPMLPVAGPLYWLDISDITTITLSNETAEILTVADKSVNGIDFERRTNYNGTGSYIGPIYVQEAGTNGPPGELPYARFDLRTNLLVQAVAQNTYPRTVFIVHHTTGNTGNGGIWGWFGGQNRDRGMRVGGGGPNDTWQWVYDSGWRFRDFGWTYELDCTYWTDASLFDERQIWFNKEWGITTAYGGKSVTGVGLYDQVYGQTSLGVYCWDDFGGRWWAGGIGEVIVYDRHLPDGDRQAVERYLKEKWLMPPRVLDGALLVVR